MSRGHGCVLYALTRSTPHEGSLTVAVEVSQTGNVIATDNGYQAPTEVTFADGAGTATLTVSTHADTVDEPDSAIGVTLTPQATHTSDARYFAQVTVTDDDETPAATLVLTHASVAENGGTQPTSRPPSTDPRPRTPFSRFRQRLMRRRWRAISRSAPTRN